MAILNRGLGFVVASYTGTTNNIALDLGFVPAFAQGWDVSTGLTYWMWSDAMNGTTGGTTAMGVVASSSVIAGLGTIATIAAGAGGIASMSGASGSGIGLVIGTDTSINILSHGVIVFAHEPM